jgi:hypothetical protein
MRYLDLGERRVTKWLREWLINHPKSGALERYRLYNSLGDRTVGIREDGREENLMAIEERDVILNFLNENSDFNRIRRRREKSEEGDESTSPMEPDIETPPLQYHPLGKRISIDSGEHSFDSKNILEKIRRREIHASSFSEAERANILSQYLPNTLIDALFDYDDHVFVGKFSEEGNRFVSAAQGRKWKSGCSGRY